MNYKFPQNPNLQNMLAANPDLMECPKCDGTGSNPLYDEINAIIYEIQTKWQRDERYIFIENCRKCHGDGYIGWTENVTEKIRRDTSRYILNGIRDTSVLFLYSCMFANNNFIENYLDYKRYNDMYYLDPEFINYTNTLKYFSMYIPLVEKYLLDRDKEMFETGIKSAIILNGLICANCFTIITNEFFINGNNEYRLVRPSIGDKIFPSKRNIGQNEFPYFGLCAKCENSLDYNVITKLFDVMVDDDELKTLHPSYYKKLSDKIRIKAFY